MSNNCVNKIRDACLNKESVVKEQVVKLFRESLAQNINPVSELDALLKLPELNGYLDVKAALINEVVIIQEDDTVNGIKTLLDLGLLYRDNELFDQAEQLFLLLINNSPGNIHPFHCLITVYIRMRRYHDAVACCQLALEINAASLTAHYNLGVAQLALNNLEQAFNSFKNTIELDPDNQWAHINLAHLMLMLGHFDMGWQHYEWRKAFYEKKSNDLALVYPPWQGEDLNGKHLLIWAEQGLGDIIMFSSLINRVLEQGCELSVLAELRLKSLFIRSFPLKHFYPLIITEDQQQHHKIDYQLPFSGLGSHTIHTFEDFGDGSSYFEADKAKAKKFREFLSTKYAGKRLIGFSWRGGITETRKYARNIPLDQWQPLISRDDCLFINLQYDSTAEEDSVVEAMGGINPNFDRRDDIEGLAAYLKALDLLISVDNSTVHLAGALGTPVWNLLPFAGEWRWFLEPEQCYWYQSMCLFRQREVDNWTGSLKAVASALT
ncbi:MAG: hypothetical protein V3T17_13670 [Pseudomonadales bacterium]